MISIFERKESLLQEADRLVLYGEAFYLDERAVEAGWKLELFFTLLEEDVGEILKPLRKQFPRLCAYEEELVRYHCAGN